VDCTDVDGRPPGTREFKFGLKTAFLRSLDFKGQLDLKGQFANLTWVGGWVGGWMGGWVGE